MAEKLHPCRWTVWVNGHESASSTASTRQFLNSLELWLSPDQKPHLKGPSFFFLAACRIRLCMRILSRIVGGNTRHNYADTDSDVWNAVWNTLERLVCAAFWTLRCFPCLANGSSNWYLVWGPDGPVFTVRPHVPFHFTPSLIYSYEMGLSVQ